MTSCTYAVMTQTYLYVDIQIYRDVHILRTTQSQEWRKLPAVMNPGGIRGTRHPKVLVDGGGGDDAAIHRGGPPVTVWYAHPDHHPADEAQHHSHHFHDRIHDASSSAEVSTKNFIQSFQMKRRKSCRESPSAWFRVSSWCLGVCEMRWVWLSRHA